MWGSGHNLSSRGSRHKSGSFSSNMEDSSDPNSRGLSRVSFMLNTTSDPHSSSESAHKVSFMMNATNGSNTFFALKTGPIDSRDSHTSGHTSADSFSDPKRDDNATSSFLAFMTHSSSSHASREMHVVPKPKPSYTGSVMSMSKTRLSVGQEMKDKSTVQRLVPHGAPSKASSVPDQIKNRMQPFYLSKEQLLQVKDLINASIQKGLKLKVKDNTCLPMLPSYVCARPDNTERGDYLGLELTPTQVKVLLLQLEDDPSDKTGNTPSSVTKQKSFQLSEKVLTGSGEQLFEFLAQCLATFLAGLDNRKKYYPLGFCLPFPCEHSSLSQCKLIKWTKDFRWPGVEGRDIGQLLQTAINQQCKDCQVEVLAVVNDTVSTIVASGHDKVLCEVGLILDFGTNCSYVEEIHRIAGLDQLQGCMSINTEWGTLGSAGELDDLITEFDLLMDKQTMDQGKCRFEKLVSGYYLCETIRIIMATLAERGELFNGVLNPSLLTKGNVELKDIVDMIDENVGIAKAKSFLARLGLVASNQDCFNVQQICRAVFLRSANLTAAGLAGVLTHMRDAEGLAKMDFFVAVNGELYKSHERYEEILQQTLKTLVPECKATFILVEDSIVLGAAKIVAAAMRLRKQREVVAEVLAPLQHSITDLEILRNLMRQEMEKGLSKETNSSSSLRMLPTYVCNLPDGNERGNFLALDLGGTNFRVLLVQVRSKEDGGVRMKSEIYTIPPEIAQSNAVELFDHIVVCIMDFYHKHNIIGSSLPLGFTFSFPCNQISLDKGILLRWTKGFSAADCVGEDVVKLLREAIERHEHIDLEVVALVNDTVGTMMACAYVDQNCEVGLIVGTGTNACYMEERKNVGTVDGDEGRMCVNMEWGAFGDNGCIEHYITSFDEKVNEESINPNQQRYEKLISGMYLGEIVRHIMLELASRKVLFKGQIPEALKTKDIFPTKYLSNVEDSLGHHYVCNILEELGMPVSSEDGLVVKEVCQAVTSRAAKMCAAGVAAVVEKIRENKRMTKLDVTVGVDGTVYKVHPYFAKMLQDSVTLLAPNCNVKFLLSEDGSGKGAALIAAVAYQNKMPA